MARVTIEDCLKYVDNMYELVHLATKRTRMLYRGADPLVKSKNRTVVIALREIAAGRVVHVKNSDSGGNQSLDLPGMSN
ncbi:MAG: DNA-directed RNA polymerase subunit omega [Candidatus Poribacteria bacterium]